MFSLFPGPFHLCIKFCRYLYIIGLINNYYQFQLNTFVLLVPEAPTNLDQQERSLEEMIVTWDPPNPMFCQITDYRVSFNFTPPPLTICARCNNAFIFCFMIMKIQLSCFRRFNYIAHERESLFWNTSLISKDVLELTCIWIAVTVERKNYKYYSLT